MDERTPGEDPGIEDLEASEDEAAEVTGGRMQTADPCEGGE